MLTITESEYTLLKQFIEAHCGIYLENGKEYLIETRLSDLAREVGAKSFQDFHLIAKSDKSGRLRDRIIDAMTTNETSWFRDASAWTFLREISIPKLVQRAIAGEKIRIWSAAASTGQEAYSLSICVIEEVEKNGTPSVLNNISILGTDISSSSIISAKNARYDIIAVGRGLPELKRNKYFSQEGNFWRLNHDVRKQVEFKEFNLQNSFMPLGLFDLILCRYVTIYFSEPFKKELFTKFSKTLKQKGDVLLLGATESLRGFSNDFEISYYKNAMINIKK